MRSAFTWEPGTWVTDEVDESGRDRSVEDPIISGVVTDTSESKVTVLAVPDRPGISASLFEPLAASNINVDMIVQNTSTEGTTDISFTMPSADMAVAEDIVKRVAGEIGATGVTHDSDIARLSLVGAGMKTSPGIAAKMFRTLADERVNIEMISTSTIRISVVIATADLERAARALHTAFGLDSGSGLQRTPPRTQVAVGCPRLRCGNLWTGCSTSRAWSWSASRSPPSSSSSKWPCRRSGSPAPWPSSPAASRWRQSSTRT